MPVDHSAEFSSSFRVALMKVARPPGTRNRVFMKMYEKETNVTIPVSITGRIVSGMAKGDLIRIEPTDDNNFLILVFDPPEVGNDGFDYWVTDLDEAAQYFEAYGWVVDWDFATAPSRWRQARSQG